MEERKQFDQCILLWSWIFMMENFMRYVVIPVNQISSWKMLPLVIGWWRREATTWLLMFLIYIHILVLNLVVIFQSFFKPSICFKLLRFHIGNSVSADWWVIKIFFFLFLMQLVFYNLSGMGGKTHHLLGRGKILVQTGMVLGASIHVWLPCKLLAICLHIDEISRFFYSDFQDIHLFISEHYQA